MAVVAPSGPVPRDRLAAGCALLRSWGLEVRVAPHVLDRHPRFAYLAGRDADRAEDLQRAWLDPEVAAVLCARGGYGATRVLELLDWTAMRSASPKILAGFSDVTALQEAFAVRLGVATLHAPMVANSALLEDPATAEGLRRALFTPEEAATFASRDTEPLAGGKAEGVTMGGCLSLLADIAGTAACRTDASGAILLLEDVGEECYRLDRLLTRLRRIGWLEGVAGIALGSWHDCPPDAATIRAMLHDRLGDLGVPVLGGFAFGHGPQNLTLPLGVPAVLDADAGRLLLRSPAPC